MIIAAALCPWPPLLVRELTGADPVAADLREACAAAVGQLLAAEPDVITIVGPATGTAVWPAEGRLNVAAFGGRAAPLAGPAVPPSVGLGCYLLDQAGYAGPRRLLTISQDEPHAVCRKLGEEIAAATERTGLLVMADGSARRGPRAPGHFDQRAAAFDAEVERAVRPADLQALAAIDPALARELMATGRPAWQVLAGAAESAGLRADVTYSGDPFGVMYLVAFFQPADMG